MKEIFPGVYKEKGRLFTKALVNESVYGEKLVEIDGTLYREWDPYRSKLAGAIKKGLKHFPCKEESKVLYLGASTGTTVSHLSDIIRKGIIFAVEISPRMMQSLLRLAEKRENIIPILADARKAESYREVGEVEVIYQDIAQRDQVEILIKNAELYLKENGVALLCLKTMSVDVSKKAKEVLREERKKLEKHFEIEEVIELSPYDKEHYFLVLKQ